MNAQEKHEQTAQYVRAIFDTIPTPAIIVDETLRIQDFNTAAEQFLGPDPPSALYQPGGEGFHCMQAEPHGCGQSEPCQDCPFRKCLADALRGRATHRLEHQAMLRTDNGTSPVDLLITASLLPYTEKPQVLMIFEDVSTLPRVPRRRTKQAHRR